MQATTPPCAWAAQCFYAFARMGLGLAGIAPECEVTAWTEVFSSPRY